MNQAGCSYLGGFPGGHAEPWLIVMDLGPEVAQASWNGLRGWIEQGHKRVKGEGRNLPRTRISSCERLERLWLAVATPSPPRTWSVFGRGWNVLRNALAVGLLLLGSWHPEPWPNQPVQGLPPTPAAVTVTASK